MKNQWEAEIIATYQGMEHVFRELTPTARARIFSDLGRGELRGPIRVEDFKRGR